ncbi:MAG TPA: DUF5327 family protein [Pseudogracilibacillus sp.]|nr:DUF5327 family protein [Pseudogracilibacillus sp.]
MQISAKTIVHKMEQQLQLAKQAQLDRDTFRLHIAKVKMLAELLLEEDVADAKANADLARAVMEAREEERDMKKKLHHSHESPYEDDGTSIFDF